MNQLRQSAEKSLKRYLKEKVKFTVGLLVGFLITGAVTPAAPEIVRDPAPTESLDEFLARIAAEKAEIEELLAQNEARLRELGESSHELVLKGDYYSKPVYGSNQVLISASYESGSTGKDSTSRDYANTYENAATYYEAHGYVMNADGDVAGDFPLPGLTREETAGLTYDQQMELMLRKNNGVLSKVNTPDITVIDLGVNISLMEPDIPSIHVEADVTTPDVSLPILTAPSAKTVNTPVAPSTPVVAPIAVAAPASVSGINVAEPQLLEPQPPQERSLNIVQPASPAPFEPLMIIPPDAPSTPVLNIPSAPQIDIHVISSGNSYDVYVDNPYGDNSVISHVGVLSGDFKIFRNDAGTYGPAYYYDNYWEYKYDNYDVINIGSYTSSGDVILAVGGTLTGLTTGGLFKTSTTGQRGFLRQLEQYPTYTDAKYVVTRAYEDPTMETDEFIHMDIHGGTGAQNVTDKLTTAAGLTGKTTEVLNAWNDITSGDIAAVLRLSRYSVMANSGEIILEGGNLSINNMYDHVGSAENVLLNTGIITLQPYSDGTNLYGGQNGVFVVSQDYGGNFHDVMYNGETGKINVWTKESAAFVIDSGYYYPSTNPTIYARVYDYSNEVWAPYTLNPTGGTPQPYDVTSSNYYYQSLGDIIGNVWSSPYSGAYNSGAVFSTVNRGEIKLYGAGSAGVYVKSAANSTSNFYYSKDTRGSATVTYDVVGVDCSSGVYDYTNYPQYGFPIVEPAHTVTWTYYPTGVPDDWSLANIGGVINVQFIKEDGVTPAPLVLYGDHSVGVYLGGISSMGTLELEVYDTTDWSSQPTEYYPISVGMATVVGNLYVDLGDSAGAGNMTYTSVAANTQGAAITNEALGNTALATIDGAAGAVSGSPFHLTSHGIRIFAGNKGGIGVGAINAAELSLGTGYINILGGDSNVAVMIDDGAVKSNGEINLLGGTQTTGVLMASGIAGKAEIKTVNVGDSTHTVTDAVGVFAVNAGTELSFAGRINVAGDNYGAFATDDGKVILSKTSLTGTRSNPDMYVKGVVSAVTGKPTGMGLMAAVGTTGGEIVARNYYIVAEDSAAGVAAMGTGSNLDLQGAVIDYKGDGYAAYSDGAGTVDLTNNGEIKLRQGTGLEMDLSIPATVLFDSTSKITMLSNDAIVTNLKNVVGGLQTSTLRPSIISYLGGVNIVDGVEAGVTYDKYKIAAVDGGNFTINTVLDKSDTNSASDSFFYYRRFLAQRMNMVVQQNVSAAIASQYATDYFRGSVTALELSSSPMAAGRSDTSITIQPGVTVTADRTDAGTGGIGVYINYGNLTNNGTVKIETGSNVVNAGGIGIYGLNGSHVDNVGTVEAAGKQAIGLYGKAYRARLDGTIVPMEFGATLTDQGATEIINHGTVKMTGDEAIGLFGLNNSSDPALPAGTPAKQMKLTNAAGATIDASAGKGSVGMYALGDILLDNSGVIKVGENGMGIFASDDAKIMSLGAMDLGKDAIGIILEGTGALLSSSTYTPTGTWVSGESGKIGIVVKGATAGAVDPTPKTLSTNINATGLDHGIALYVKDRGNFISTGNIQVGNAGIGMYLDNGDAENTGTINLGTNNNAVGMYSEEGILTNSGSILVGKDGQMGMVAYGPSAELMNAGTITINASNAAGIYVKNGALTSLAPAGIININGSKNFAIFAEQGDVTISAPANFTQPNANQNMFVYAKEGSVIHHTTGLLTVDGVTVSGNNKTIGIYLNNSNGTNNLYDGTGGTIKASGGAIGLYSKNGNTIRFNQVEAAGDKTVGIYLEGGGTLKGKVLSNGAAAGQNVIGIYANGGTITIDTGLALEMGAGNTGGLGMYLEGGAAATGAKITVENKNTTGSNVGLYYTGSQTLTHNTDIDLSGNEVVGVYTDNGIKLTFAKTMGYASGATAQVGAYVLGQSGFKNTGTIDVTASASAGIFAGNGSGENAGIMEVHGANSAGLIAQGQAAGQTASVVNSGTLRVQASVGLMVGDTRPGMGAAGTSAGVNSGTIDVAGGAIGVVLSGNDDSTFDNGGGTINATGAGGLVATGLMALDTSAGQILSAGKIALANQDSLAVYARNAAVDFDVKVNGNAGGTGVFAAGTNTVSSLIDAGNSSGTTALYVQSPSTVINGAHIITGTSLPSGAAGVGIYLADNFTLSNTTVDVTGNGVGVAPATGKTLTLGQGARINTKTDGTGIYLDGAGTTLNTAGGTLAIDGAGTGIAVNGGAVANVGTTGAVRIEFTGSGGAAAVSTNGGVINLGTNITTTGKGTLAATVDGNLVNHGTVTIENGVTGLGGAFTTGGTLENAAGAVMHVLAGGIGMSASGTGVVSVINNGTISVTGDKAVGMASDVGTLTNASGTITTADNGIGIFAKGNAVVTDLGNITATGGVAFVASGSASAPTGNITLLDGAPGSWSIGGYFENVNAVPGTYTTTQSGDYSIGTVVKTSGNVAVPSLNALGGNHSNQIGLLAKGAAGANIAASVGAAVVLTDGSGLAGIENIGIYGNYADIDLGANSVTVGRSPASLNMASASKGIYLDDGSFKTAGNITVGDESIGILGKNITSIETGAVAIGDGGIGIYGIGAAGGTAWIKAGSVATGNENSAGIYAKDADVTITGGLQVGHTSSMGLISEGDGDVSLDGNISVADVQHIDQLQGSVAFYKNGNGGAVNIGAAGAATIQIGREGYGIYVTDSNPNDLNGLSVDNRMDMGLATSAVGFYGKGNVTFQNSGDITVGDTYLGALNDHADLESHRNSVGIYADAGVKVLNSGDIDVRYDHSVGLYGRGADTEIRITGGTITVDNGGVGILAKQGAKVFLESAANLHVLQTIAPVCGASSMGIAAYGGAAVVNEGTITVDDGIGIYVAPGARFTNEGNLILNNGTGVTGGGVFVQGANAYVTVNGGVLDGTTGQEDTVKGSVTIGGDGVVQINDKFIAIGGTLDAGDAAIKLDGAYVAIEALTNAQIPLFKGEIVEGNIKLLPDFAKSGNGYEWTIENFDVALGAALAEAGAASKVGLVTSPLFVKKQIVDPTTGNSAIRIAKAPYQDMVVEPQFLELYEGLDNVLYANAEGSTALKNFNSYLEGVYDNEGVDAFDAEVSQGLAETRGDIYGTIQKRMQHVQNAMDSAWGDLERQYNVSRDSSKYSVVMKKGSYKDDTVGVDGYDYRTEGLLYMREFEGRNYFHKYGYSLGFGVSKFKFDDASKYGNPSSEYVYSVRAGVHNVTSLFGTDGSDRTRLLTKLEIGYNRHEAARVAELDKAYKTKGKYHTWNVSLDNKIEQTLSRGRTHKIDLYGAVNLEYGGIGGFKERKGDGVPLQIKDNDYFSAAAEIGIQGHKRIPLGKKLSAKLEGSLGYSYEFGENYKGNKARVMEGGRDYYNLITPEKERGAVQAKIGLTLEKANKNGITFEVQARKRQNRKDLEMVYGVSFKHVFGR
jgi:hypothetical protein